MKPDKFGRLLECPATDVLVCSVGGGLFFRAREPRTDVAVVCSVLLDDPRTPL